MQEIAFINNKNKAINYSNFITLGGVQQYLIIRGANIENPVLLLLHGGTSETAHFVKFNLLGNNSPSPMGRNNMIE